VANILLVEDDVGLAEMLSDALAARGYRVWHAATSGEAEQILEHVHPDLVVLDLMLPDRNGLILCSDLKARALAPIIICSATKRRDDAVLSLRLGADDFVAKPFSVDELDARIGRLLQLAGAGATATPAAQRLGALVIDRASCEVRLGAELLRLTPTEYRLLCALMDRPGEVRSRKDLAACVWGFQDDAVLRTLDVHMRRLRGKLRSAVVPGPRLVARRGFGYQLMEQSPALALA
jgi:DNA-binding response OmpR family regulator